MWGTVVISVTLFLCWNQVYCNALSFMLLGDWGLPGQNQSLVAEQMGIWGEEHKCAFVVALGDNFYYNGVDSVSDFQWYSTYSSVFTAKSLQVPWYVILGNHDYNGEPAAQIDYYKQHVDNRWTMPGHLFSSIHPLKETGSGVNTLFLPTDQAAQTGQSKRATVNEPTLQVVYIDTLMLAPLEDPTTRVGGKHYVPQDVADKYLASIEAMLATSTATWLIVCGHYTIYSVADHGNTQILIDRLAPLLRRHGVVAYFNGHDHVLQHVEHDGVSYFTAGHGTHSDNFPLGAYNARLNEPGAKVGYKFSANGPGFATVQASERELKVGFIDKHGNVLYETVLNNPRQGGVVDDKRAAGGWVSAAVMWLVVFAMMMVMVVVVAVVSGYAPLQVREYVGKVLRVESGQNDAADLECGSQYCPGLFGGVRAVGGMTGSCRSWGGVVGAVVTVGAGLILLIYGYFNIFHSS